MKIIVENKEDLLRAVDVYMNTGLASVLLDDIVDYFSRNLYLQEEGITRLSKALEKLHERSEL